MSIVTAAHAFKIEAINEDVAQYLRHQLITAARQAREHNQFIFNHLKYLKSV